MSTILSSFLYAFFSIGIIWLMVYETNRRIKTNQSLEYTEQIPELYSVSGWTFFLLILVIGISIAEGYRIAEDVSSVIGIIKLGVCYIATLGAAIIDIKLRMIPNYLPTGMIFVRLLIFVYEIVRGEATFGHLISSLLGATLCIVILVIANKLSSGGIGGGDIKLLAAIGFVCGVYVVVPVLLMALIVCVVVGVVLVILKKATLKEQLPFGPFIYVGFAMMCFFNLYK